MGKQVQVDLDAAAAARREAQQEAPVVVFKGEEFVLPVEMPFAAVEALRSLRDAGEDGVASGAALADMVKALFTGEDYKRFLGLSPTVPDVEALVEQVTAAYGADQGESPASES